MPNTSRSWYSSHARVGVARKSFQWSANVCQILRGSRSAFCGFPSMGATPSAERDPRKIWQTFADHWKLFRATPTRAWLEYELREVFGVQRELDSASAQHVYDMLVERLPYPTFRP